MVRSPTADEIAKLEEQSRKIAEIAWPGHNDTIDSARKSGLRFVHYSSASTLISLLDKKRIWLRNARFMNDFSEVVHGQSALLRAFSTNRARVEAIYKNGGVSLADFEAFLSRDADGQENQTWIGCLSEHRASEDTLGRLSMWRAYGGEVGAATIFQGSPWLSDNVGTSKFGFLKVNYADESQIERQFVGLLGRLEANAALLMGRPSVLVEIMGAFFTRILFATKHPGFTEEIEWRVVVRPLPGDPDPLESAVHVLNGVPQIIYKLDITDGLGVGSFENLVDRVIIGPSENPKQAYAAIEREMAGAGINLAKGNRLINSSIPLRRAR